MKTGSVQECQLMSTEVGEVGRGSPQYHGDEYLFSFSFLGDERLLNFNFDSWRGDAAKKSQITRLEVASCHGFSQTP